MLNTKLVLIALALAAGLVASDTTSIAPDSVIPETDNAPLSSKVKAGPMMKKTSDTTSIAPDSVILEIDNAPLSSKVDSSIDSLVEAGSATVKVDGCYIIGLCFNPSSDGWNSCGSDRGSFDVVGEGEQLLFGGAGDSYSMPAITYSTYYWNGNEMELFLRPKLDDGDVLTCTCSSKDDVPTCSLAAGDKVTDLGSDQLQNLASAGQALDHIIDHPGQAASDLSG